MHLAPLTGVTPQRKTTSPYNWTPPPPKVGVHMKVIDNHIKY